MFNGLGSPYPAFMQEPAERAWAFDPAVRAWRDQIMGGFQQMPQGGDYDYMRALIEGVRPSPYEHDQGRYHWPSTAPSGASLKSKNHPTAWMETFMQQYGVDPFEAPTGLLSEFFQQNPALARGLFDK